MRISDWSSDVCSSDLRRAQRDGLDRKLFDLGLQRVDLLVALHDLHRQLLVAVAERGHRLKQRLLGATAHLAYQPAQAVQIPVKGLDGMIVDYCHPDVLSRCRLTHSGRCYNPWFGPAAGDRK